MTFDMSTTWTLNVFSGVTASRGGTFVNAFYPTPIKTSDVSYVGPKGFLSSSAHLQSPRTFQSIMYFSHSFILAILPFFTAAIPLAQPRSRGIAIPISKRLSTPVGSSSLYESQVQSSVA